MIGPLMSHIVSAAGDGTLSDLLNDKIAEAKIVLGGGGTAVVLGFFIVSVIKRGFALGAILIAGVVAGLCLWIMNSGMGDMEKLIDKEVNSIHQVGQAPAALNIPIVQRSA